MEGGSSLSTGSVSLRRETGLKLTSLGREAWIAPPGGSKHQTQWHRDGMDIHIPLSCSAVEGGEEGGATRMASGTIRHRPRPRLSDEISVFVKTGDSVQLDIQTQKLPEFDDLFWTYNKSDNIVKYINEFKKVTPYKDGVYFNAESFSLTLKDTQKTDSGLYTARTSGKSEKNILTYRVSVIDAVEAPVLTVNSNFSNDSCTVNFTCRAHDLMINSSYQNNKCFPEEVTSQINSLILNCSEESIICNHSNPVSWKKDRINITQLCVKDDHPDVHQSSLQVPIGLVAGCLGAVCLGICLYCKCKKGVPEADSTVYAQVETQEMQITNSDGHTYDVPERVQDQTQKQMGDTRPDTMYCTVGQHQKPAVPVETDLTIYSVVCKQSTKKPPTISSDDA